MSGLSVSCAEHKAKSVVPPPVVPAAAPVGEAYIKSIEKQLRDQIVPAGVSFLRDGSQLLLIVQGNLLFETDQYEFKYDAQKITGPLVKVLTQFPPASIDIKSYTDSTGPLSWNQRLSEYRAKSLKDLLQTEGVIPDKISATGFGPQNPIESNSTELGRQANRRVEIRIQPPSAP